MGPTNRSSSWLIKHETRLFFSPEYGILRRVMTGCDDRYTIEDDKTFREGDPVLANIDNFSLVSELGGGAFGTVYKARDNVSGVEYAVKGLPPLVKTNREEMERIKANFALVSRLTHQHIAKATALHEAKEVEYFDEKVKENFRVFANDPMMVMEYAEGMTLSAYRRDFCEGGLLSEEEAVAIIRQVAEALDYAHFRRIIHRDIKPSNVVVELREGSVPFVRVLDFGLAAEVRSSMGRISQSVNDRSGTRQYMAPEQWDGNPQGPAADQYALAVMFYELVTGDVPFASVFDSGDPVIMREVVTHKRFKPPKDMPSRMGKALSRALSKKPEDRFPSCIAFVDALEAKKNASWWKWLFAVFAGALFAFGALWLIPGLTEREPIPQASAPEPEPEPAAPPAPEPAPAPAAPPAPEPASAPEPAAPPAPMQRWPDTGRPMPASAPEPAAPPAPARLPSPEPSPELVSVPGPAAGDEMVITLANGVQMRFRYIPAGWFMMGSSENDDPRDKDECIVGKGKHKVTISRGFWLGETEVTQAQWESVMKTNPSYFKSADRPVESVSWNDCHEFMAALSNSTGKIFRLPTEAEWEYACRAGTDTSLPSERNLFVKGERNGEGLNDIAWYGGNSNDQYDLGGGVNCTKWAGKEFSNPLAGTHPVAKKQPNAWGLYDMIGNVSEWCADAWSDKYYACSPEADPRNDGEPGDMRILRGGCWSSRARSCRSASRLKFAPDQGSKNFGFRLCLCE